MREAVIHIPHSEFEKIGLGDFITVFRDAGLRDITELSCETDGCLMVITVESPIAEESLASVDYLEWWERLSGEEDKEVYLCKIAFPGFEENIQPMYSALSTDEIQVSSDGFDVAVVDS